MNNKTSKDSVWQRNPDLNISSTSPFPLFCSVMQEGASGPRRRKQEETNSEAENITMKGERGKEKKGTRKIKNVSRAEQAGSRLWA